MQLRGRNIITDPSLVFLIAERLIYVEPQSKEHGMKLIHVSARLELVRWWPQSDGPNLNIHGVNKKERSVKHGESLPNWSTRIFTVLTCIDESRDQKSQTDTGHCSTISSPIGLIMQETLKKKTIEQCVLLLYVKCAYLVHISYYSQSPLVLVHSYSILVLVRHKIQEGMNSRIYKCAKKAILLKI
jgi:hypothetical protein